jgi:hypothetical protein
MFRPNFVLFAVYLFSTSVLAQDWAEFLGKNGAAKSSDSVVTTWSESENLLWKYDLPGAGSSSPIIVGHRIFVTCYSGAGTSLRRHIVCVDKNSGKQIWGSEIPADYREDAYNGYITEHGYASNTPVSDGEHLFVFLGKGGVHAFDLRGNKKWSVDVGKESSNRRWGSAASPVLFENSVIVNAAEENQAIIALEKATGKELWRQEAAMLELSYGTPRLVSLGNGQQELVISVPEEIWAINPTTGKLKWYAETPMTGNVTPSVIVDGTTIFSFGGYRSSGSLAVRAGGKGDVTDSHTLWSGRSSSYVATPLLHEGRLYWIDDRGIAYCTSAKDGEVVYRERVQNLQSGRPVYSSPTLIGENIYVVTRRSGTVVYPPGNGFNPIAQNVIAGDETDFNASPAVSEGKIYLRSNQSLYCIGG